jgi:hypothetical protein
MPSLQSGALSNGITVNKLHGDYGSTHDEVQRGKAHRSDSNLLSVRVAESVDIYEGFVSPFATSMQLQLEKPQKQMLAQMLTSLKRWDELNSASKIALIGEVKSHYISIVSNYLDLVITEECFEENRDFFVNVFSNLLDNQKLTTEDHPCAYK